MGRRVQDAAGTPRTVRADVGYRRPLGLRESMIGSVVRLVRRTPGAVSGADQLCRIPVRLLAIRDDAGVLVVEPTVGAQRGRRVSSYYRDVSAVVPDSPEIDRLTTDPQTKGPRR